MTSPQALGPSQSSQKQFASHACTQIKWQLPASQMIVHSKLQIYLRWGGVLLMLKDRLKIWHSYDNRNVSMSINILCSFFCFRFNEIPKIKCINLFHHCSVLTHQVCSVGRQQPAPVPPDTHRCI